MILCQWRRKVWFIFRHICNKQESTTSSISCWATKLRQDWTPIFALLKCSLLKWFAHNWNYYTYYKIVVVVNGKYLQWDKKWNCQSLVLQRWERSLWFWSESRMDRVDLILAPATVASNFYWRSQVFNWDYLIFHSFKHIKCNRRICI